MFCEISEDDLERKVPRQVLLELEELLAHQAEEVEHQAVQEVEVVYQAFLEVVVEAAHQAFQEAVVEAVHQAFREVVVEVVYQTFQEVVVEAVFQQIFQKVVEAVH